ncbi:J domain-containing protein [Xanthomonas vasicola]|uniref:J domain-containing protein n=1 Tax=Xanthomonas vasicola TaxID=56459 RepID=UPI000348BE60|nr:J domain-containing protein [Xanthomonas vasicola]KFA26828.1 membrane protein [Xanthomonas vasicola pv. vasculorum NCPPB 1381]
MSWYGKLLGALAGALMFRGAPVVGLMIGLAIGHAVDAGWFKRRAENPYEALGLEPDGTAAEIDLAYRRLISRYHPDKMINADPEARRQAEKKASQINAAYDRIQRLRKR